MKADERFPIKVKDVTISSEEYEKTLTYIDELTKAYKAKSEKLNNVIGFMQKLFSLTEFNGYEDCIYDPDAEIWVGPNMSGDKIKIAVRKKQ